MLFSTILRIFIGRLWLGSIEYICIILDFKCVRNLYLCFSDIVELCFLLHEVIFHFVYRFVLIVNHVVSRIKANIFLNLRRYFCYHFLALFQAMFIILIVEYIIHQPIFRNIAIFVKKINRFTNFEIRVNLRQQFVNVFELFALRNKCRLKKRLDRSVKIGHIN